MKKSVKAALFSGFVFPGAGYFVVKQHLKGFIFFLLILTGGTLVGMDVYQKAMVILNQVMDGSLPLDPQLIQQKISSLPDEFSPILLNVIGFSMMGLWIFSIFDSYRLGKKLDLNEVK
jgi:hypothetical protein